MQGKRNKPAKVKRSFANVVRRAKVPSTAAPNASNEPAQRRGSAHVISRKSAAPASEDSAVLLTPPQITLPMGKGGHSQAAGSNGFNALQTNDGDEYTVEEGRPLPPRALLAIAESGAPAAAPHSDKGQGYLVVTRGNDLGRRVPLLEGRTTIGRGLDNDIVLTDIAVSRRHMYIERRDNVYFVCDLSSGNGLQINDKERSGEVLIVNGDSFRIGNTIVAFAGPEAQQSEAGSTTNWRPEQVGRGKAKARQLSVEEESTVAGKGIFRQREAEAADPLTQAPTYIAPSVEVASDIREPQPRKQAREQPREQAREQPREQAREQPREQVARAPRPPTKPPPLPASLASVEDAAVAAVDSIIATPAPPAESAVYVLETGDLPNMSIPPTPSPAIPYPINPPAAKPRMTAQGMPGPRPPAGRAPMPQQPIATMGAMPGGAQPGARAPAMMPMNLPAPMRGAPMQGHPQGGLPMTQGSGPLMMPGMGPGPMGYPGSGPISQHSQPMMGLPSQSGDMRGYGFESGRYQQAERGRLLIGIISVALVLVAVGIVAAVMGQKEDGSKSAASEAIVEPGQQSDPARATDPGQATDPAPATDPALDDAASEALAGNASDAGATKLVSAEPAAQSSDAGTAPDTARGPILLASLSTGNSGLPASTWGTDESFLADLPDVVPKDLVPEVVQELPVPEISKPDGAKTDNGKGNVGKTEGKRPKDNASTRKPNTTRNNRGKSNDDDDDDLSGDDDDDDDDLSGDDDDDDDDSGSTRKGSGALAKNAEAAKSDARDLYKRSKFQEAADLLDRAAEKLDDKQAEELLDMATSFKQVGQLLSTAEKSQNSDPGAALDAYKQALLKDKRVGGSALTKLIRLRIGQVAPKAAKSYMAKGRLADAKKAADDAARYEEGAAVKAVYDSLERKADSLIRKALDAKKKGDTEKAKDLLRDATKIAPKDTEAFELSRKELKKF